MNKYQRKLVEDLAYSLANNGKRPPAPPRKKRAEQQPRNLPRTKLTEPEESQAVEAGAETQEPQPDDKQRGLFDRIKDTLTSGGE